jgi:hypothetical protein
MPSFSRPVNWYELPIFGGDQADSRTERIGQKVEVADCSALPLGLKTGEPESQNANSGLI